MKTAIIQLRPCYHGNSNIPIAEKLMEDAVRQKAELLVLPEMFNCPYSIDFFKKLSEHVPDGATCRFLSSFARKHGVTVVGGSVPEVCGGKIYNTSPVFGSSGRLIAKHRKIHLFDISLKSVTMKESAVLTPGDTPTVFRTPFGNIGLVICYDIRFPELFRMMLKSDIKAVVMPGAFTMPTGKAHWKLLMQARAVDNQIYMIAASPARNRKDGYKAYGHSMVTDPFGEVVVEAGTDETVIYSVLDRERVRHVRSVLPLLKHRR